MEFTSRFNPSKSNKTSEDSDTEEVVFRGHNPPKATTQWQYRRLNGSDRSERSERPNEPINAPVGDYAQHAANFQKFYRAVVSPSHVRVTAGGRIVPNVRAPPQPIFVWNKEKFCFDAKHNKSDSSTGTSQDGGPLKQVDSNLQHRFGALNIGSSTGGSLQSSRTSYEKSEESANGHSTQPTVAESPAGGVSTQPTGLPQPIKLSPPENFDPMKPFTYVNGLWVPIPYSGAKAGVPVPVMPLNSPFGPGFAPQRNVNAQFQAQHQPMGAFGSGPPTAKPAQKATLPSYNIVPPQLPQQSFKNTDAYFRNHKSAPIPSMKNTEGNRKLPPPKMIMPPSYEEGQRPPSTPKPPQTPNAVLLATLPPHIACLTPSAANYRMRACQAQIDHIDRELQYNFHQIDPQHCMNQRATIQNEIDVLNKVCVAWGSTYAMFTPVDNKPMVVGRSARARQSGSETVQPAKLIGLGISVPFEDLGTPNTPADVFAGRYSPKPARATTSENHVTSNIGHQKPPRATVSESPYAAPVVRKKLSPSAAKAPEFKPRNQAVIETPIKPTPAGRGPSTPVQESPNPFDTGSPETPMSPAARALSKETDEEAEARLIGYNTLYASPEDSPESSEPKKTKKEWGPPPPMFNAGGFSSQNGHGASDSGPSAAGFAPQISVQEPSPETEQVSFGTLAAHSHYNPIMNGVPYLSGFKGPEFEKASGGKPQEYQYNRPLSAAEFQARAVYWGTKPAPQNAKLPKFDGKDFYLASPKKFPSATASQGQQGRVSEASTVVRKASYSANTSKGMDTSEEASIPHGLTRSCYEQYDLNASAQPELHELQSKRSGDLRDKAYAERGHANDTMVRAPPQPHHNRQPKPKRSQDLREMAYHQTKEYHQSEAALQAQSQVHHVVYPQSQACHQTSEASHGHRQMRHKPSKAELRQAAATHGQTQQRQVFVQHAPQGAHQNPNRPNPRDCIPPPRKAMENRPINPEQAKATKLAPGDEARLQWLEHHGIQTHAAREKAIRDDRENFLLNTKTGKQVMQEANKSHSGPGRFMQAHQEENLDFVKANKAPLDQARLNRFNTARTKMDERHARNSQMRPSVGDDIFTNPADDIFGSGSNYAEYNKENLAHPHPTARGEFVTVASRYQQPSVQHQAPVNTLQARSGSYGGVGQEGGLTRSVSAVPNPGTGPNPGSENMSALMNDAIHANPRLRHRASDQGIRQTAVMQVTQPLVYQGGPYLQPQYPRAESPAAASLRARLSADNMRRETLDREYARDAMMHPYSNMAAAQSLASHVHNGYGRQPFPPNVAYHPQAFAGAPPTFTAQPQMNMQPEPTIVYKQQGGGWFPVGHFRN